MTEILVGVVAVFLGFVVGLGTRSVRDRLSLARCRMELYRCRFQCDELRRLNVRETAAWDLVLRTDGANIYVVRAGMGGHNPTGPAQQFRADPYRSGFMSGWGVSPWDAALDMVPAPPTKS